MKNEDTWPDKDNPGVPENPNDGVWYWVAAKGLWGNWIPIAAEWFDSDWNWKVGGDSTRWTTAELAHQTRYLGPCELPKIPEEWSKE